MAAALGGAWLCPHLPLPPFNSQAAASGVPPPVQGPQAPDWGPREGLAEETFLDLLPATPSFDFFYPGWCSTDLIYNHIITLLA